MDYEILENGNLKLKLTDPDDKDELQTMMDRATHLDHGVLADILEHNGWPGNGELYQVPAEAIGALTDAPILSDDIDHADDGTITVRGKVWWYPEYQVYSFAEELLKHGEVVFTKAPD